VSIMVLLMTSLFVLLFAGFGSDMTNLFFRRGSAQGAADAACVATAMDLFVNQTQGAGMGGFSLGTSFDCAQKASAAPCKYAALNGYSSPGLTAGVDSNDVSVTFPGSINGVTTPATNVAGFYPFIQVTVTDRVKLYFAGLLSGSKTQDVHAIAKCGLQTASSPVPMIILNPTQQDTFDVGGTPNVTIVGGPPKSIEINSSNTAAVNIQGSASVDLTQGGPSFNGSSLGVFGGPSSAPGGFQTANTGSWQAPSAPVQDPFKNIAAPTDTGVAGTSSSAAYGVNGCPDHNGCTEYTAGDYSGGLLIQNATAIFDPGVYFIKGGTLDFHSNSTVRPSTLTGDGSMGVMFYLTCATPGSCGSSGDASVYISANSGGGPSTCPANGIAPGSIDCFATSVAPCPGGPLPTGYNLPTYVTGNVLLGPCTNNSAYQAPPTPVGTLRGMLFFSDRSAPPSAGEEFMAGGGGLLLVGTEYFRECAAWPTCTPPPVSSKGGGKGTTLDYQTVFHLTGGSGSGTRLIGFIVTDELLLRGTSGITMDINPFPTSSVLKVALLQ